MNSSLAITSALYLFRTNSNADVAIGAAPQAMRLTEEVSYLVNKFVLLMAKRFGGAVTRHVI